MSDTNTIQQGNNLVPITHYIEKGFKDTTLTITRLCYPSVVTDETSSMDSVTGMERLHYTITQFIGLNFIIVNRFNQSSHHTVAATQEVYDYVMKNQLHSKFNTKFELDFNSDGVVEAVRSVGILNTDLDKLKDRFDINYDASTWNKFNSNPEDKAIKASMNDNTTDMIIIKKLEKTVKTIFKDKSAISDVIESKLLKVIKATPISKLKPMDIIENPNAVVIDVRNDNILYIKLS